MPLKLDELVTTLREEYKKLCDYLTDLDESTTSLSEPGGSIRYVKHTLWGILNSYSRAMLAIVHYEEDLKVQHQ